MDYKQSGVNIEEGDRAVDLIKTAVAKTFNPLVLNGLGSFGGFFALPKGYEEPILVSCTDGVGTKLKIAIESQIFNTVGIDLVAMNVNDLICSGAKPLFFLDYIACHQLHPEQIKELIDGMVDGCLQSDCALIGGEMAEMNDLYQKGDYDLAGFAVGVLDRKKLIDGSKITPNQYVYGVASSGIHSNGFSLVRKVLNESNLKKYGMTAKDLLIPTRIYAKLVMELTQTYPITGIAHITGGGLADNLARIVPSTINILIDRSKIPVLDIFNILQKEGNIRDEEMWHVFNMGVGLIVVSDKEIQHPELMLLAKTEAGNGQVIVK